MKQSILLITLFIMLAMPVTAQYNEPDLQNILQPKNLYDEGFRKGLGFSFGLNDFGFGVGMQYRMGLSPYTEGLINLKIAGLRDPSEQTQIDYYFGNRTIASKYQRVITFPVTVGLKRRFFARQITDNFRVHASMAGGPAMAVMLPYFYDANNNGYREADFFTYGYGIEPINDIFQGWDQAKTKWGWNGELVLGIDFGDNFARLQSFQFGYSFFYFNNGLQILEPNTPIILPNGQFIDLDEDGYADYPEGFETANNPIKFFGSAQITFIIGWMWD